jgi:hypothetical protein
MRASGYDRADADWYVEPASFVEAIVDAEGIAVPSLCWDPAAGCGTIPKVLRARGIECAASDIVDRGCPDCWIGDFFSEHHGTAEIIISNPPFGVLVEFVDRALDLASDRVIVVARLAFLESIKRMNFFRRTPIARVYVSGPRQSMPPGGVDMPAKGGSIAYGWYVWEIGWQGDPLLRWLG